MYCIASRRVLSALTEEERQPLLTQAHLHTLVEMLEVIPDPRGKQGLRYDRPYRLICLIAALLCNCETHRSGERVRATNTSTCLKTSLVPVRFSPRAAPCIAGCFLCSRSRPWNRSSQPGSGPPVLPLPLIPSLSMAKPCEEPGHLKALPLTCFPASPERRKARLGSARRGRKNQRDPRSSQAASHAARFSDASVPLMRCILIGSSGSFCVPSRRIHSL